jgi:hypothetical protein
VSSDLLLGGEGTGLPAGRYHLQVKRGTEDFANVSRLVVDGSLLRNRTVAEFIATNELILLRQGMSIGRTINSDWTGLTAQGSGRYLIRLTYTVRLYGSEVPSNLQFPLFQTQLTSNVVEVEVEP